MARSRWWFVLLSLVVWPVGAEAQKTGPAEVLLIYKDGFAVKGFVKEDVKLIFDKASGRAFPIFTGKFSFDDRVRTILFSRDQIHSVAKTTPAMSSMVIRHKSVSQGKKIYPHWEFNGFDEWNTKGERTAHYLNGKQAMDMRQRIAYLTPAFAGVMTTDYPWNMGFFTQEFGPKLTRDVLYQSYNDIPELKKRTSGQKLIEIATFLQEMGWFDEAEKELDRCATNFPTEGKLARQKLDQLKVIRAVMLAESIQQAKKFGQHHEAIERLKTFEDQGFAKLVTDDLRDALRSIKVDYDNAQAEMTKARNLLKALPAYTKNLALWSKAGAFMSEELTYDSSERLSSFISFAEQHLAQRKKVEKLTDSTEEVLAMAVNAWLLGKSAGSPDVPRALKLLRARELALEVLKTDDDQKRADLISRYKRDVDLSADYIARMIRALPAPDPFDAKKMGTEITTMTLPNSGGYLVQLPPDYQPLRSYPVLLILSTRPEATLKNFSEEAARLGFILAAPQWAGKGGQYKYSAREHALVLGTLRDLRRRCLVDSDRVFMFGWEEGANMACDVGLGHPDLFAGVAAMNATVPAFTRRYYWNNALYLPLYLIDGERNLANCKVMRELITDRWTRSPYQATYVEYKGRGTEWYSAEVPLMMDWMKRKKRFHPVKELGRYSSKGYAEEFHSSRPTDTRFYWLSTDTLGERNQCDHDGAIPATFTPAKFQADLTLVNQKKEVWNQLDVRVEGVKQLTVWLTLEMLENPLQLRVNGTAIGARRRIAPSAETMLEELWQTGDRQRLFVGKIDVKLQ